MIGERVRLAREVCGFTQQDLAAAAEIGQATLSDLESGRILRPADDVVARLAHATGFPPSFFARGPLPDLPEGRFRRLKKGASMKIDRQIRAQVRHALELVQEAEGKANLPPVVLEAVASAPELESVADHVRRALSVGAEDPIRNVMRAAERTGTVVFRLPTEIPFHDGFSAWPNFGLDGRPIIAVTGRHSGDRDRFTVAHELGHLVLHTARKEELTPIQAEREANRFAGALLLPSTAAKRALKAPVTLHVLMAVKAHFGISIAASAQRALDLDLITRAHFVSLRKQMSARKWTKSEPVEVNPESPVLIHRIIDELGGHSKSVVQKARAAATSPFALQALSS